MEFLTLHRKMDEETLASSKACGRVPVFYVPLINSLSLASQTGQSPNLFKISVFLMTEMEGDDINLPSHQFIFNQQAFVHFDASISSLIFYHFMKQLQTIYDCDGKYFLKYFRMISILTPGQADSVPRSLRAIIFRPKSTQSTVPDII